MLTPTDVCANVMQVATHDYRSLDYYSDTSLGLLVIRFVLLHITIVHPIANITILQLQTHVATTMETAVTYAS